MPDTQVSLSEVYTCSTEPRGSTDFIYVLQSCRVPSIWCHTSPPLYQWQHLFRIASLERRGGITCQQRVLSDLLVPGAGLWLLSSPTCCLNRGSEDRHVLAQTQLCLSWFPRFFLYMHIHKKTGKIPVPQSICPVHPQITSIHTHANHNTLDEKCASVPC